MLLMGVFNLRIRKKNPKIAHVRKCLFYAKFGQTTFYFHPFSENRKALLTLPK